MNVCFTSLLPESELELVADTVKPSEIGVSCYIHAQEWDLEPFVESETSVAATEEGYSPILNIRGLASRKYSFFIWNIIIIMVILPPSPNTINDFRVAALVNVQFIKARTRGRTVFTCTCSMY